MGRPSLHRSQGQVAASVDVSPAWSTRTSSTDGFMFDGSSIAGWKAINESDMILKPDLDAVYVDPFSATPMMILFCDIVEPGDRRALRARPALDRQARRGLSEGDRHRRHRLCRPRSRVLHVRRRPLRGRLQRLGLHRSTTSSCRPTPAQKYDSGNLGHRPRAKGGYFPVAPVDSAMDIRGEMVSTMLEMGLPMRQAPPRGRRRAARARPHLRHAGPDRRPDADLQICRAHGRPCLRQDRDLHAQADQAGQRLGHAHPHVDLEGRQAAVRRQRLCRPVGDCASISSAA